MQLDARTEKNLVGVHSDLVRVVRRAAQLTPVPFIVTEGVRTPDRQQRLLAMGASRTRNSRHLTGHAVDVMANVPGDEWHWPLYRQIAVAFKAAAKEQGARIVWGGDWKSFKDGPHFELDRKFYP